MSGHRFYLVYKVQNRINRSRNDMFNFKGKKVRFKLVFVQERIWMDLKS